MANRTLAQLNDAIKTEMQLDPGLISDAERKQFINDCLTDIGNSGNFEKQVALTFEGGVATLPDDFVEFIALLRSGVRVKPAISNTSTGYITRYPEIEIVPATDETLTLWYSYAPVHLEENTDVPDVPTGFDSAIVDYAVARAHRKNGNIGLYREYMSAYEDKKFAMYQRLTRLENARVTMIMDNEGVGEDTSPSSELLF